MATVIPLPAKITGVYFTLWSNGGSVGRITSVPNSINQINLFHATPAANGSAVFSYGSAVTAAECATCQARGQRIVLTFGGANAGFNFQTRTQSQNFVSSIKVIIDGALGGNVSGIDYNNYETFIGSSATEMLWISQQLAAYYGPNFSFTTPPHPNFGTHPVDKAVVQALAGSGLSFRVFPQYYDSGDLTTQSYITSQTAAWVSLLGDASKVGIAYGASYGGGSSVAVCVSSYNIIKGASPTIGGVMGWSAQDDKNAGWAWSNAMQPVVGSTPATGGGTPPPPPSSGVATLAAPSLVGQPLGYGALQLATISVTVTTTNAPIAAQKMIITMRAPGATHGGGPYLDFFIETPSTFPLGARTFTGSRTFTASDAFGTWEVYGTWQDAVGIWHDGPSTFFTYAAVAPTPPPVVVPLPVAAFGVKNFSDAIVSFTREAPWTFEFDNRSSGAVSYAWDFGDNTPGSSTPAPSHTYTVPGNYSVSLVATNETGNKLLLKNNYILITTPAVIIDPPVIQPVSPDPIAEQPPVFAPEAQMVMQLSVDGKIFSAERSASLGKIGEYKRLVRFNRLGSGRMFVVRVRTWDPIDISLTGAAIELTPGKN